mmetsp:Transcript_37775/g.105264  ORF Transcript_37775/g.105264 Transcript_37775/m.105264 type:complete len:288 (-) Transcript_37775:63-926(-)
MTCRSCSRGPAVALCRPSLAQHGHPRSDRHTLRSRQTNCASRIRGTSTCTSTRSHCSRRSRFSSKRSGKSERPWRLPSQRIVGTTMIRRRRRGSRAGLPSKRELQRSSCVSSRGRCRRVSPLRRPLKHSRSSGFPHPRRLPLHRRSVKTARRSRARASRCRCRRSRRSRARRGRRPRRHTFHRRRMGCRGRHRRPSRVPCRQAGCRSCFLGRSCRRDRALGPPGARGLLRSRRSRWLWRSRACDRKRWPRRSLVPRGCVAPWLCCWKMWRLRCETRGRLCVCACAPP